MMSPLIPLSVALLLAGCAGTTVSTGTTTDAATCGIAVALAAVTGGPAAIPAAIATTPACLNLPADVIAQIEGTAKAQAPAARRALGR